ncbi:MAG: RNA polymerase factor sigma-54 [Deltaproteobacteria bacterium]|nr:RNA polymerase factor sigma-54 [Deltaproteobacteria bacterium]
MALEIKLSQKMMPQLVMTPQLQQAIKLLQLSQLDLQQRISQELQENPALEEARDDDDAAPDRVREPEATQETLVTDRIADWQDYLDNHSNSRHDMVAPEVVRQEEDFPSLEDTITRRETLHEHLLWQLRMAGLDPAGESIGLCIIGNLDERGYLETSLEEVGELARATLDEVEDVLARIQLFDPVGIAARDLRECLLVQLHSAGLGESVAARVVAAHLRELERKQYERIAAALDVGVADIIEAAHLIACLEPKPARDYDDGEVRTIIPDVVVQKVAGEYVIFLNDDGVPPLRISPLVRRLAGASSEEAREAKEYLDGKIRAATWLIKSIQWRQQTLYRVSESIFNFQREFLDHGVDRLKPLVLREVAAQIGMHPSTVSRATSNKYVHTPQGVFELKYFFQSGIPRNDSSLVVSAESVRERIRVLVESEDPGKPLSDQEIAVTLRGLGIDIARRTVAKYREQLGILPSSRRRDPYGQRVEPA